MLRTCCWSAQSNPTNAAISVFCFITLVLHGPRAENRPAGNAQNPYSRVLEGHHLRIRPVSRADRVRKSPPTVDAVGWLIRNAIPPVFHKGNSFQKKKKKESKKKKKPVENAAAVEIPSGWPAAVFVENGFPPLLGKASLSFGFPTFPTGPTARHYTPRKRFLENYKGWLRDQEKRREASALAQTGWCWSSE